MAGSVSPSQKDSATTHAMEDVSPASRAVDVVPDYGKPWWKVPHLLRLNLCLLVPLLSSYVSGFDGSMMNGMQGVPSWVHGSYYASTSEPLGKPLTLLTEFHNPQGSTLGLVSTMQTIGAAVSLPFAAYATDKLGRRHPIFLGSVILIMGAALQAGAKGIEMFLAGRFFVGFGGGFVFTSAPAMVAELAYPTHRSIVTAIYNTTWVRTNAHTHRET